MNTPGSVLAKLGRTRPFRRWRSSFAWLVLSFAAACRSVAGSPADSGTSVDAGEADGGISDGGPASTADGLFTPVGALPHAQVNDWFGLYQGSLWETGPTGNGAVYSLDDGSFQAASFAGAWTGFHGSGAAIVVGSNLYLLGGGGDGITSEWLNTEWDYVELTEKTWVSGGNGPASTHSLAVAANGTQIIATGGNPGADTLGSTDVEILDTDTATWSAGAPLPTPRAEHGAAVAGSTLIVAGGVCNGADCPDAGAGLTILASTSTLDISQPSANWQAGPSLPVAVERVAVVALGGRFYCLGGASHDASVQDQTNVLSWAPGETSWRLEGSLPEGMSLVTVLTDETRIVLIASSAAAVFAYIWTPGGE